MKLTRNYKILTFLNLFLVPQLHNILLYLVFFNAILKWPPIGHNTNNCTKHCLFMIKQDHSVDLEATEIYSISYQ